MNLHQFSKRQKGEFFYSHTEPIRFKFQHSYKKGVGANANWFGIHVMLYGFCDRGRHCAMTGVNLNYKWYWTKSEESNNETVHNIHQHILQSK